MSLFNAISPLNGGNIGDYYKDWQYPLDLNGAQDYTRPQTGFSPFPYPLTVGYVSGLLPLMDAQTYFNMRGDQPFGPFIGAAPANLEAVFPNIQGGLQKVGG